MRNVYFCIVMRVFVGCGPNPCPVDVVSGYKETAEQDGYKMTLELEKDFNSTYSARDIIMMAGSVIEAGYELGFPNMEKVEKKIRTGHVIIVNDSVLFNELYFYIYGGYDEESGRNLKDTVSGFIQYLYLNECVINSDAKYIIIICDDHEDSSNLVIHEFIHLLSYISLGTHGHGHDDQAVWGRESDQLMGRAMELFEEKQLHHYQ